MAGCLGSWGVPYCRLLPSPHPPTHPLTHPTHSPVGDSLNHLTGTITGPSGTPYDGGVFKIDIQIPTSYPFEPPKMRFVTKIWYVLRAVPAARVESYPLFLLSSPP